MIGAPSRHPSHDSVTHALYLPCHRHAVIMNRVRAMQHSTSSLGTGTTLTSQHPGGSSGDESDVETEPGLTLKRKVKNTL